MFKFKKAATINVSKGHAKYITAGTVMALSSEVSDGLLKAGIVEKIPVTKPAVADKKVTTPKSNTTPGNL